MGYLDYSDYQEKHRAEQEIERQKTTLPMDHAELRELAAELSFIMSIDKFDRLKQVFEERIASRAAYHDGERYHEREENPIRTAENALTYKLRHDQYEYHPLVTALVALLKVPKEQAIAVVVEHEVAGYRRTMVDLIHEAYRKLSRPTNLSRRAS